VARETTALPRVTRMTSCMARAATTCCLAAFIFFPIAGSDGATVWQFDVFSDGSEDNYAFTGSAALTLDNVLIQAESFAYFSFSPTLNLATGVLDQLENSRDGSYEIVYGEGGLFGTNIGFSFPEVQIYRNVSLGRSESATGPLGGQDKFDFSGLGLTTSGLILTDLGINQQFTLYDFAFFNTDEFSNSYVRALDFFQDGSNGDRAIHAEYDNFSEGNSMVVYVDVNGDCDLDTRDDLVFRIDNLLLSPDENELGSEDLAQELTVDQVDDLFILTTSQYNLWFA